MRFNRNSSVIISNSYANRNLLFCTIKCTFSFMELINEARNMLLKIILFIDVVYTVYSREYSYLTHKKFYGISVVLLKNVSFSNLLNPEAKIPFFMCDIFGIHVCQMQIYLMGVPNLIFRKKKLTLYILQNRFY